MYSNVQKEKDNMNKYKNMKAMSVPKATLIHDIDYHIRKWLYSRMGVRTNSRKREAIDITRLNCSVRKQYLRRESSFVKN